MEGGTAVREGGKGDVMAFPRGTRDVVVRGSREMIRGAEREIVGRGILGGGKATKLGRSVCVRTSANHHAQSGVIV